MKQGAPLKRSPLARKTGLRSKPKKKLPPEERQAAMAFHAAVFNQPCAMCGTPWLSPDAHHVVAKAELKRLCLPLYHPDNALPLCPIGSVAGHACHELHENGHRRIARSCLTDRNLEFASRALGERAGSYLARHYA